MTTESDFQPRFLTASDYVLDLFGPTENVAVVVRNRATGRTIQRIARADTVAGKEFQTWFASQNGAGSDVFLGMNPIKHDATSRIKANIEDIRTVYLDLDRKGDESLQAIRNSSEVPPPNFVLDTSPGKHQVVWKINGVTQDEAESLLRALANEFDGDPAATQEAARSLGISLRTVDRLIALKELPVRRLGRRVLIPRASLESFLRSEHPTQTI